MLNHNIKTKIREYLFTSLGMYDYRKGWLKGDCPYCSAHKFGVNLAMNRSNCFKCGSHPPPIKLIAELEGLATNAQVYQLLGSYEGLEFKEEALKPYERVSGAQLPEGYKNIRRGNSHLAKAARNYVRSRGFDVKEMSMAGWGYGTKGKYIGYLIMPYYINNELVYFNARLYSGADTKFKNPPVEDFGLGKSMLMYNMDALSVYNKIWLVESIMNAATIGPNAIGAAGKAISNWQLNTIIKSPVEKVIIGLDDDAMDDAIRVALRLFDHKKVKIVQFPKKQDINDIGRKKSLLLSYRTHYLKYGDIIRLKNSLPPAV